MAKKYTEMKAFDAIEIRGLCVANNWFNAGTNDEYEALFKYVGDHRNDVTAETIIEIAGRIECCTEHEPSMYEDYSRADRICNIATHIDSKAVLRWFECEEQ